jgi:hypothetical protein
MLIEIAGERVVDEFNSAKDEHGLRLFDRNGEASHIPIGGLKGSLRPTPEGKLALDHGDGASLIDPASDFAVTALAPWDSAGASPRWNVAFLGRRIDSVGGWHAPYDLDRDALKLPDPGYSEPSNAALLPNGREVAISIVRCNHMVFFDIESRRTRLVDMPGAGGANEVTVRGRSVWMVNYDTLCEIDIETLRVRASPTLQPPYRDKAYGFMTHAFVGRIRYSDTAKGWLVPRPYSGDILLVDPASLSPRARIDCGGKPYDVVEFRDGRLLIQNHPFDSVQISSLNQLKPL